MPPKRHATEDLSAARLSSRQNYLQKREEIKLAELRQQVAEEAEEERNNPRLSSRELEQFRRNRLTLQLATERARIDDGSEGFFIPDASDLNDKEAVLKKRHKNENYKSEVQMWEDEQTSKAKAAQTQRSVRETEDDYEFVFDPQTAISFVNDGKFLDPEKERLQSQLDAAEKKAKDIQDVRTSLPIHAYKEEILEAVDKYQTLVLTASTGTGKSSQIPQYMLEYFERRGDTDKIVLCTQPRRIAAISLAQRVSEEFGCRLGNEVGYTIRFEDKSGPDTRIKYMTDGTLLRMFLTQPDLPQVGAVIIDEAHERTLATDILMGLLKDVVKYRTELKIIISSATLDAQMFAKYWDLGSGPSPVLFVPGVTYPVQIYYASQPEANYLQASLTTAWQIHIAEGTSTKGDILLFLTGEEEIEMARQSIEETKVKLGSRVGELICLPLYSSLPPEEQQKIFIPPPPGVRRLIISTNIAETSLTIDGVRSVIDTGFSKENVYNQATGLEQLVVNPISRASANQRAGRAGRTGPGKCYRIFTEFAMKNDMEESSQPEITRVNLCSTILLLKSIGVNDLLAFPFLSPPSPEGIATALETLYCLGALDSQGTLTKLGRSMSELPIEPKMAKTIISAEKYGCLNSVLTIVAMLGESGALFFAPKDKKLHLDAAKRRFYIKGFGDYGAYLNIYRSWEETEYDPLWTKENFLQSKTLNRVRNVREQLEKLCEKIGLTPSDDGEPDQVAVKKAFTAGYFASAARMSRDGQSYQTLKSGNQTVWIHPSSWVHEPSERPKWLLYSSLVLTSKEFLRSVIPIDPEWLTELAPFYYKQGDIGKLGGDKKMPKGRGKVGVDA